MTIATLLACCSGNAPREAEMVADSESPGGSIGGPELIVNGGFEVPYFWYARRAEVTGGAAVLRVAAGGGVSSIEQSVTLSGRAERLHLTLLALSPQPERAKLELAIHSDCALGDDDAPKLLHQTIPTRTFDDPHPVPKRNVSVPSGVETLCLKLSTRGTMPIVVEQVSLRRGGFAEDLEVRPAQVYDELIRGPELVISGALEHPEFWRRSHRGFSDGAMLLQTASDRPIGWIGQRFEVLGRTGPVVASIVASAPHPPFGPLVLRFSRPCASCPEGWQIFDEGQIAPQRLRPVPEPQLIAATIPEDVNLMKIELLTLSSSPIIVESLSIRASKR